MHLRGFTSRELNISGCLPERELQSHRPRRHYILYGERVFHAVGL